MSDVHGFRRPAAVWCGLVVLIGALLILAGRQSLLRWRAAENGQGPVDRGESQRAAPGSERPAAAAVGGKEPLSDEEIVALLSWYDPEQSAYTGEIERNRRKLAVPEAFPGLARVLRDEAQGDSFRGDAATAVGWIGSQAARDLLVEVLAKTPEVFSSPHPREYLFFRLTDALTDCMKRESEKQLIEDLRHESHYVRRTAAKLLGERKSSAAVVELIRLLDDPHLTVPSVATRALGEIRDPKGIEELIAIVEKRRGGGDRSCAINAIKKVGTPRCIEVLRSLKPEDLFYWQVADTPVKVAKAFKARASGFVLVLQWIPGKSEETPRYESLMLTVPKYRSVASAHVSSVTPAVWEVARISEEEATRIIDRLLEDGFFERARDRMRYSPLGASRWCLEISVRTGPQLWEASPCDLALIERLQRLRNVLPEESDGAKAMDTLLEQLGPQREQWEKEAAAPPEAQ